MKPIVLITTCKKNYKRIISIEKTWANILRKNNIPYLYVTSDELPSLPTLKLENFTECYEQLALKTYFTLDSLRDTNFTHFIKLDDDVYFDYEKINFNIQDFDYVGKFNKVVESSTVHYYKVNPLFKKPKNNAVCEYAEGGFYILSKKSVDYILDSKIDNFKNTPFHYKGEDVVVGEILNRQKNLKKLDLYDSTSEKINMDVSKNGISFHPVHYSIMELLYTADNLSNKIDILLKYSEKNEYNKRDIYLKIYEKNISISPAR